MSAMRWRAALACLVVVPVGVVQAPARAASYMFYLSVPALPSVDLGQAQTIACKPNDPTAQFSVTAVSSSPTQTDYNESVEVTATVPNSCKVGVRAGARVVDRSVLFETHDTAWRYVTSSTGRKAVAPASQTVPYLGLDGTRGASIVKVYLYGARKIGLNKYAMYACGVYLFLLSPAASKPVQLTPDPMACDDVPPIITSE